MKRIPASVLIFFAIIFCAGNVLAENATGTAINAVNSGDTAFVLISAALVLFMTPGLAFFYGGMVRRKNMLSVLMQCFALMCVLALQWILFGYSLAFGPDVGGIIGSLKWIGLNGVGMEPNPDYAATIPHQTFMIFQCMFAVITPALIIGAVAERIKFSSFFLFMILWATFVYDPIAHWVWGAGGWLRNLGVLDFAGGGVVHINAGIAALVMCLLMGKREGYQKQPFPPHNLPFTVLGTGLLWFGWFGFNAGSALSASGLASNAFVTTNTAAAAAGLTWALIEWKQNGSPTMLGAATGAVAGLATITPACGYVNPLSAIFIGMMASAVCFHAVALIKPKFGYDDSLDVFGVHGVGGILGILATGIFAQKAINAAGNDGLLFGNFHQFLVQLLDVLVTVGFSAIGTFVLYKAVDAFLGMRVTEEDEIIGLDITQHKEAGYTVLE
jgi:Amt family ammonium transporter